MTSYEQRKAAEAEADQQTLAYAKAAGFMDCLAIRNALGWDKPGPTGRWYDSMQTAYRWIRDAGEEVVYLIPDGYTKVAKSKRTGCYPKAFARVLAYKEAVYAKRKHDEWTRNMASALEARQQEGAQTKNMDWDVYIEGLGPEPPAADDAVFRAVEGRWAAMFAVKAEQATLEEGQILQAMREYTGPMNKRGRYPKGPFMGLTGKAKRELWDRRNE